MPRVMLCGAFSSLMHAKENGGYRFAPEKRSRYLRVLSLLELHGFEVFFAHRADQFGEADWIEDFVDRDLNWAKWCDVQLVMLPADDSGEALRSDGTMIEMGYALAHGKPIVVLADGFNSPRNSFFLNSFLNKNARAQISWIEDYESELLEVLANCVREPTAKLREHRTDVDGVIADLRRETEPHAVHVAGLDLTVLPGVLSPRLSHAPDALIAQWRIPQGARVLDLGCGSGVLGLAALAQGAGHLVALDISPAAVETTNLNLQNLKLLDRGEARRSDCYSALRRGEAFDVIIFAAPYWDRQAADDLEKSCFDLDYVFFGTAIADADRWLTRDGSMYIIFSDQGDVDKAFGHIESSSLRIDHTHFTRPTQPGGHIRIIWELRRRDRPAM